MTRLAKIVIGVVAVEHIGILVMEMFLWTSLGVKVFKFTPEYAEQTTALAMNQGLYNGFLAAGLIWSLLAKDEALARKVALFFLGCVVVAGVFGGLTAKLSIILTQALPAAIGLALVLSASRPASPSA
jgi:putative membrane protein